MIRAHVAEARGRGEYDRRRWRDEIMNVKCCMGTDCKSLLIRRGSTPAEKRLRLDLEILRDQYYEGGGALQFAWVNAKQQLSGPLTKNSVEAFAYLRHVLLTGFSRSSMTQTLTRLSPHINIRPLYGQRYQQILVDVLQQKKKHERRSLPRRLRQRLQRMRWRSGGKQTRRQKQRLMQAASQRYSSLLVKT